MGADDSTTNAQDSTTNAQPGGAPASQTPTTPAVTSSPAGASMKPAAEAGKPAGAAGQAPADAQPPSEGDHPTAGEKAGQATEPKFTQAEVDRMVGDRAKHAKSAERAALLKELGVENLDAAKTAIQAAEAARKAQMTETERLQAEKAEADRRAAEAQAKASQALAEASSALIKAEVVSKAAGKFASPQAAFKLVDLSGVTQNEDGSFTGIEEALDQLAKAEPWTLAPTGANAPKMPEIGPTNPKSKKGGSGANSEEEMRERFFGSQGKRSFFQPKPGGVRLDK